MPTVDYYRELLIGRVVRPRGFLLDKVYSRALERLHFLKLSPYNSEMIRAYLLIISITGCPAEHYYVITFC